MKNVIDVLQERGFVDAMTSEELRQACAKPVKLYCGFDPSSDSLHLGNLIAIMGLAWFQKFGHTPVAILGGATGMIGDPSGKKHERSLLDSKTIENNVKGIQSNLEKILDFTNPENQAVLLNNYDWFEKFSFIEFLRDVGKHFRIGPMLAKDSVKTRLQSEEGMSFTEFSYQLLQGYDFLYLHQNHNVTLQIGGSDQWGNITAGTELIRKVDGGQVYGLTFPLLLRDDGQKFGKSEQGALWLSPEKTSPYEFYQYLYRTPDADVIKIMRMLTFMEMEEIRDYEMRMRSPDYVPNTAQKRLAEEVTRIVHGEEGLQIAQRATEGAKPGSETALDGNTLEALMRDIPSKALTTAEVNDVPLVDLFVLCGLQESKGQARRLIRNGGAYLNNVKLTDEQDVITPDHLIDGHYILLSAGKKNKMVIRVD